MAVVDDPINPLPKPKKAAPKAPAPKQPAPKAPRGRAGVSAADFALVQRVAKQYGIDPYILVAIGIHETGWGTLGDGRNGNILGVGSYDSGSTYKYAGLENQLVGAARILKRHGVRTIADIAAGKLAPAGDRVKYASDPNWSNAIVRTYNSVAGTKFTGTVSTAAGKAGSPTVTPTAPPAEVRQQVAQSYGYLSAFLDDKEIGPILQRAATEGWDMARLQGALYKTRFWKTHSATTREWDAQAKLDPATARAQIQQQVAALAAEARKTGLAFQPGRLAQIALNSLRFGWSGKQISNALLSEGKYSGKGPSELGTSIAQLKEQAAQYLVPLSEQNLQKWAKQIVGGELDAGAFDGYLKEQAKSLFPGMSAAIDSGVTVAQYVEPYQQLAAQTLELAPEQINFLDPKWGKALFQVNPKDGTRTSMSLADWQAELRSDPIYGWDKTQQAKTTATDLATELATMFGAVG